MLDLPTRVGWGLLALSLAGGCAADRGAHVSPASTRVPSAAAAGDLMSAHDREALAALASEREAAAPDGGYRIGPDDLLDVRIPDVMDAGGSAPPSHPATAPGGAALPTVAEAPVGQGLRVTASGDVTIPLIGAVHVEGLTPAEAQDEIGRRLRTAGILRAPQVCVLVVEYRSRVVAVLGSVERPGLYPLTRPRATLSDLIWAAGGPSEKAGRVVRLVPAAADAHAPAPADMAAAAGAGIRIDLDVLLQASGAPAGALNPRVRPGDVVQLAPAGVVLVDGWVDKPGSYPVTRGLTLTGAVTAAGGRLFPADGRRVTVQRVLGPDEQGYFTVDLDAVSQGRAPDFPITDGDVVRLPAATVKIMPYGLWIVAKEVIHVGGSFPLF